MLDATSTGTVPITPTPRHPLDCPVEDWLAFLGHRWNALLLWHLQAGMKRTGELEALLPGVSAKMLAERLTGLQARGLVERLPLPVFPKGVGYRLTADGQALVLILDRIELWARRFDGAPAAGRPGRMA